MTRGVIVRPDAESEMAEAIERTPFQFPLVYKNVRRALTRRFPYQIFFVAEEERVVVLAVFHARRDPKIWQGRH
jgi:plasmid stabilization system protein ParE